MKAIKEYIGCIVPTILLIAFVGILFYFNGREKENGRGKEQAVEAEDYVYIDAQHTMHMNINCFAIGKETGDLGSSDKGVLRIPIKSLTRDHIGKTCSRCVSDADYEMLIESIGYYAE